MNAFSPLPRSPDRAANDRAPRERRSALVRFVEVMQRACCTLWGVSTISAAAAINANQTDAGFLFIGAALASAVTLLLATEFGRRLNG